MIARYKAGLRVRADGMLLSLEGRLDRIMQAWLLVAGLASALRIASSPIRGSFDAATLAPYVLLILAPFATMVLALRWFNDRDNLPQPRTRLARAGAWRQLTLEEAKSHSLYGASGIMVSLLVGMLLNVPVRAAEFLVSMPALSGPIPSWLTTLNIMMTVDVVVFTSLYTAAFVAAMKRVPLFPRLLVVIWVADLAMQLVTAELVAGAPGLPHQVASALQALLTGNVHKVLISMTLWMPYLLLSRRVNVTYRWRVRAPNESQAIR